MSATIGRELVLLANTQTNILSISQVTIWVSQIR